MSYRYERDSRGLQMLLQHEDMGRAMESFASTGRALFESIAPERSGTYKASLRTVAQSALGPTPRRAQRLEVVVDYAADVERHHGTLGKVADILERQGRRR